MSEQQENTAVAEQPTAENTVENQAGGQVGNQAHQPEAPKPEVPEKYEFQAPDGLQLDETVMGEFSNVAKEIGLSQEHASAIVNKLAPIMAQQEMARIEEATHSWAEESRNDKEFGGARLDENLAIAKKAVDTYGGDTLKSLLNESGLGNHPEVIRFMYRVGQTLKEDTITNGGQSYTQDARALFPNTPELNP